MVRTFVILTAVCLVIGMLCRLRQMFHLSPPPAQHIAAEPKMEPNDWFMLQRAWPQSSFDEKLWRQRIEEANQEALAMRGTSTSQWEPQGANNIPGRVNTLCAHPTDNNIILAGYATGGIYKTIDGGDHWYPVFDAHPLLAISDITYDPSNPQVVYAATGDPQITITTVNGFGIYKSTDGGETWSYHALADVGIITKIEVSPTNSQVIFASAQGNPFKRDQNRGVYKSTDGGLNWQRVLFVSTQAGACDMVMHPTNPLILYASFWERIRTNTESTNWGTDAKIFKTTDGGTTWTQLTNGLPSGPLSRTGLCISQQNPDKLYAVYVDTTFRPKGIYKTIDGGANWVAQDIGALSDLYGNFGWYFGKIRCNRFNDEELYALGILLRQRLPGSSAWLVGAGVHADIHDIIFLSNGVRFVATDGGIFRNTPGSFFWEHCTDMATTQFYHFTFNPHHPWQYWGGTQDNGTVFGGALSGTNNWLMAFGGDGFDVAFHPTNPDIIWVQTQNGGVHLSTDGGSNFDFNANCLGTSDRCGWDVPLVKSVHHPDFLYSGTYRVYVSTSAAGLGWASISPDLTDGVIYGPRFHVISTLNESPLIPDRLFAGTSDGNVWRSGTAGQWVNISAGLPDRFVTSIHGSPTHPERIYVTHSGIRYNEYIPHIHRSDNNGMSWTDISANLPQVPVNDLLILPGHKDSVLLAATDAGVYLSKNSGASWGRLGTNMPSVITTDIEWNHLRQEVGVATFGRGIFTMPIAQVLASNPVVLTQIGAVSTAYPVPTPVRNAQVRVNNQILGYTNTQGFATLVNAPAGLVNLRKDTLPANGVDVIDVLRVQRHILGLDQLNSPYKMVAADVNNSRSITSADIVEMRKVILGAIGSFSAPSWRFLPADFSFTNPFNPFLDTFPAGMSLQSIQNGRTPAFVAVKSGDVDGNAATQNNLPWHADERNFQETELLLIDESPGSALLAISAGSRLAGAQFALQSTYEIMGVEPLHAALHNATYRQTNGELRFCFTAESLESQGEILSLYRIRYKPRKGQVAAASDWRLSNTSLKARAMDLDGHERNLTIKQWRGTTSSLLFPEIAISPNPVTVGAEMSISCKTEQSGLLQVLRLSDGAEVLRLPDSSAGTYRFTPHKPGVYLIRLEAAGKQVARKVVVH